MTFTARELKTLETYNQADSDMNHVEPVKLDSWILWAILLVVGIATDLYTVFVVMPWFEQLSADTINKLSTTLR